MGDQFGNSDADLDRGDHEFMRRQEDEMLIHVKRDPTVCPNGEHEFVGWREFADGRGGETVCKHCGVGAMDYTLALDF